MGKDERMVLLRTLIAVARSDGHFAEVEKERIRHLVGFLGLGADGKAEIEPLLADDAPAPALPAREDLPDYETRLYVFQQALILIYADGVLHEGEHGEATALAQALELKTADVDRAWRRASEMASQ